MSLTSVAAPIWNEIAETQKLATAWARKAFRMDPDQMAEFEDKEYADLVAKGVDPTVAISLLDVTPLLEERTAISRYLETHPDLRSALPELATVNEAVILASKERPLSPSQQTQLRSLLQSRAT